MLRVRSLGSGSKGNATLVDISEQKDSCLLIDCGFSVKQFIARLEKAKLTADLISGIFVTHEHSDHVGCCVKLAQKLQLPIWMSHGTYTAIGAPTLGKLLHIAADTVAFQLGSLQVTPFTVPHDAREPLQLRCDYQQQSLGILTDLGWGSPHVIEQLRPCETVVLECNYDTDMLAKSPYPPFLKQRISGKLGHLNNMESKRIAHTLHNEGKLRKIIAAHLSEKNNSPTVVDTLLRDAFANQPSMQWEVACPEKGTKWITA